MPGGSRDYDLNMDKKQIKENMNMFIKGFSYKKKNRNKIVTKEVNGLNRFERYASFDYCYNYFYSFHKNNKISELVNSNNIQTSCLHLACYLASWGMFRGSSQLLQKSIKFYEPIIKLISESKNLWYIDVNNYNDINNLKRIRSFNDSLTKYLLQTGQKNLIILNTKIMLGVFGCLPALDNNFKIGFKKYSGFGPTKLTKKLFNNLDKFYHKYLNEIEYYNNTIKTFDFLTKKELYKYSRAKIIDMIFFIEGYKEQYKKNGKLKVLNKSFN